MLDTTLIGNFVKSPVATYIKSTEISETLMGVRLEPDVGMPEFALHRILKSAQPVSFDGVDYGDFKYLRNITTEEFAGCQQALIDIVGAATDDNGATTTNNIEGPVVESFFNLMTPAFFQQTGPSILTQTTEQIIKINDGFCTINNIEPMIGDIPIDQLSIATPTAFLPHDSMFSDVLEELTIFDVLSIFPEAEARLLALSIGRGLVGPDGSKTKIGSIDIAHAFRTFCLVYGEPGTGKSTLFQFLFDAIKTNGYKISNFNNLDTHFGLGEIVDSNFAYSDDLLTGTLKSLLQAPLFKQMITGAQIRAHIKYANDVEVRAKSVFIANINNFDAAVLNFCDAGTLNRVAIITTKTNREIKASTGDSLSKYSEDLRTRENIEWMAKSFDVSIDAIMLKFARLCADYFYSEISNNTLENTINKLKRKLRTQLHESIDDSVVQLIQFAYLIRTKTSAIPQMTGPALEMAFKGLNFLMNDDRANHVRNLIKEDWVALDRPSNHIFSAIKLLDNVSIANAASYDISMIIKDSTKVIKALWQEMRLSSGFNVPAHIAGIKQNWNLSRANNLKDFMAIIETCKDAPGYDELSNPNTDSKTEYLYQISYDREAHIDNLNN